MSVQVEPHASIWHMLEACQRLNVLLAFLSLAVCLKEMSLLQLAVLVYATRTLLLLIAGDAAIRLAYFLLHKFDWKAFLAPFQEHSSVRESFTSIRRASQILVSSLEVFVADLCGCGNDGDEMCASYDPIHRQCINPDGTLASAPAGCYYNKVPDNFLAFYKNKDAAEKAWRGMQEWREKERVGGILSEPRNVQRKVPHFFHGHSKEGYPVLYEQMQNHYGDTMAKPEDMGRNFVFLLEFIANELYQQHQLETPLTSPEDWGFVCVIDVKEVGFTALTGNQKDMRLKMLDILSSYYPKHLKQLVFINAPRWLTTAFSNVTGARLGFRVRLASETKTASVLREFIDDDQIPSIYGGSSTLTLGQHVYDQLYEQAIQATLTLNRHNAEMPSDGDENSQSTVAAAPPANKRPRQNLANTHSARSLLFFWQRPHRHRKYRIVGHVAGS